MLCVRLGEGEMSAAFLQDKGLCGLGKAPGGSLSLYTVSAIAQTLWFPSLFCAFNVAQTEIP